MNGEPFHRGSATGITLSNLFSGWPPQALAQLYSAGLPATEGVCSLSLRMSNADLAVLGGLLRAVPEVRQGAAPPAAARREPSRLRRVVVPLVDLVPYRVPEVVARALASFRPEVIYTNLGNIRLARLVNALAGLLRVPVVPHFMDDYLSTYSVRGRSVLTAPQRWVINRVTAEVLQRAPLGLAIGDAMADEFSARFGRPFSAFMNPVQISERRARAPGPVRFVYAGGLHLGRAENLADLARAVAAARGDGVEVELSIYAPAADLAAQRGRLEQDGVRCGSARPEELPDILAGCDVAVHVESFERKHAEYTRLSVSTKLPQYLGVGLPVLAYAPEGVASTRYVRDAGCGVVVPERGAALLAAAVKSLALDSALRERLGQRGIAHARARHDEQQERERFREVLARAAGEGR